MFSLNILINSSRDIRSVLFILLAAMLSNLLSEVVEVISCQVIRGHRDHARVEAWIYKETVTGRDTVLERYRRRKSLTDVILENNLAWPYRLFLAYAWTKTAVLDFGSTKNDEVHSSTRVEVIAAIERIEVKKFTASVKGRGQALIQS